MEEHRELQGFQGGEEEQPPLMEGGQGHFHTSLAAAIQELDLEEEQWVGPVATEPVEVEPWRH